MRYSCAHLNKQMGPKLRILGYSVVKRQQGSCYWGISHGMTAAQAQYWDPHSADDDQQ